MLNKYDIKHIKFSAWINGFVWGMIFIAILVVIFK